MNNRRTFIFQSGIAAAAFLVSKPYKAFAGISTSLSSGSKGSNLVLLHTANLGDGMEYATAANQIISLEKKKANATLLHAGNTIPQHFQQLSYDVSWNSDNTFHAQSTDFRIIYKNNIRIGVINIGSDSDNPVAEVNTMAARLKKEENCALVVCLSQLGYKNKNSVDDITLAGESTDIDAIIGGHVHNFSKSPVIIRNKNRAEVIINHSTGNSMSFGKIEIDFDAAGRKRRIGFGNAKPVFNA